LALAPKAEDFRYSAIEPHQLPGVMRRHIYTGAMGATYWHLTNGMFLVAFGNAIGVSVAQWSVLSAVCCFALSAQLVSAYCTERYGYRRLLWFIMEFSNRALRGIGFFVSFFLFIHGHAYAAAAVFVGMMCLANFFMAAGHPPWFSWFTDIIPEKIQGTFWGRREAWVCLAALGMLLPASYALDRVPEEFKTYVLVAMFGFGLVLGTIDVCLHRQIPEPAFATRDNGAFHRYIVKPLQNADFRRWLTFNTCWNFSQMVGGALATVYFVDNLRIRDNFLGGSIVLVALPIAATMLTTRWSGRLVDRLGVKRVLIVSTLIWALMPIFWVVATPASAIFWLAISSIFGGVGVPAATNAGNKLILRLPDPGQRAIFVAVNACLANIGGGLGPLVGGLFLETLSNQTWTVGAYTLVPFQMLFVLSLVLRLAAWLLAFRIKTPGFDVGK